MRYTTILLGVFAALVLATPAVAQEIDGFWPGCGAPGDPVLIRGDDFAEEPEVSFGTTAATVFRSNDDAILCHVPEALLPGEVALTVDGVAAAEDFLVLAEGAPVVHRLSATRGPVGMPVFVFGRRLQGGTVAFVDAGGVTRARVDLRGGRRAAVFKVPEGVDPGTYTLLFTNDDDLDTGACSPTFEVVEKGDATLDEIDPVDAPPCHRVECLGTNLAPPGPCTVTWTDADDEMIERCGFANGYDRVVTHVPFDAESGVTYDVEVEFRDGSSTNALSYTVGTPGEPIIDKLEPDAGPAGSVFAVLGRNLLVPGSMPEVEMSDGEETVEAEILFACPGRGGRGEAIVAAVPDDLADGEYDVRVTVGGQTSNAVLYTVGALDLSVDRMTPTMQGRQGTSRPVFFQGTGFGNEDSDVEIQVVWDDGTDLYEGEVRFRSDQMLLVIPPGGEEDPLPVGTYTVRVVLDPDGEAETAEAGTYTVR